MEKSGQEARKLADCHNEYELENQWRSSKRNGKRNGQRENVLKFNLKFEFE